MDPKKFEQILDLLKQSEKYCDPKTFLPKGIVIGNAHKYKILENGPVGFTLTNFIFERELDNGEKYFSFETHRVMKSTSNPFERENCKIIQNSAHLTLESALSVFGD